MVRNLSALVLCIAALIAFADRSSAGTDTWTSNGPYVNGAAIIHYTPIVPASAGTIGFQSKNTTGSFNFIQVN